MTEQLVWDQSGTREFETGVSRGTFYPINGIGEPWNGLVSVVLDPLGGDVERYYFDGVKYMERALAEEFKATVQAISTPKGFEACEGIRSQYAGMKTHFNKRDKFHMTWRTNIGNDENPEIAYKLHVAYNCLVAPTSRNYQTVAATTTPDIRSFEITTTPACGRHSYYTFDSRECDLTDLEALLNVGTMPHCWELPGLLGIDPSSCPTLLTDFEEYFPGQILNGNFDDHFYYSTIAGKVNNGLDETDLPANGTITANDATITTVGTADVLADDDDASYISTADGDLGYTIQLPALDKYIWGSLLELHIRMSISGDVSADDPENIDADAQVFLTTDAAGDDEVGGFTDGTDEGMGFALTSVDGTPVDYVVPLNIEAWTDTTMQDVVDALEAGAYLNIVSVNNNNPDTTPEVRVYEASVVMINATDRRKFLRVDEAPDFTYIYHRVMESADGSLSGMDEGTPDHVIEAPAVTFNVDFKAHKIPNTGISGTGWTVQPMSWYGAYPVDSEPALLQFEYSAGDLVLRLYDQDNAHAAYAAWDSGLPVADETLIDDDIWYSVQMDWSVYRIRYRLWLRSGGSIDAPLKDVTLSYNRSLGDPKATAYFYGGTLYQSPNAHDIYLDNAKTSVDCHVDRPSELFLIPQEVYANGGLQASGSAIWSEDPKTDTSGDTSGVTLIDTTSQSSANGWLPGQPSLDLAPSKVTRLVVEIYGAAKDTGLAPGDPVPFLYLHAFHDGWVSSSSSPYVDCQMEIEFPNDSTLTPIYREFEIVDEFFGYSMLDIAKRLNSSYNTLSQGQRAIRFQTRGGSVGAPAGTKNVKILSCRIRVEYEA